MVSEMDTCTSESVKKEKLWLSFVLLTLFDPIPRNPLRDAVKTLLWGEAWASEETEARSGRTLRAWKGRWL